MAGVEADDGQPGRGEAVPQPGRQRAGLQPDPDEGRRAAAEDLRNRLRMRGAPPAPSDLTGLVDDADDGLLHRHIQTDVLTHGGSPLAVSLGNEQPRLLIRRTAAQIRAAIMPCPECRGGYFYYSHSSSSSAL